MATVKPNEVAIKALQSPSAGNQVYWLKGKVEGRDVPRGLGVVVTAGGAKSFILNYRFNGRQRRYTIGRWPEWSVVAAVREARKLWQQIDRGDDPLAGREAAREAAKPQSEPVPQKTVAEVLDEFMRSEQGRKLRRPDNYEQAFNRLVKPAIGSLPIYGLRRSKIAVMLDGIADENGPVMADRTLQYLASALNWYASRDDEFAVPQLKKLKRATGPEHKRDRVLTDDEIRTIWRVAESNGTFGAVVRFLLLTGQRPGDVYGIAWGELGESGVWTIPAERYKTARSHTVPLSNAALELVNAQPHKTALVFPDRKGKPFGTNGYWKQVLDAAITKANGGTALPAWTLHDLRRTARTLMGDIEVPREVAELVLGHVVGNDIEQRYNRSKHEEAKRRALEMLARKIADILDPQAAQQAKVVPLRA
jgi:integrase